MKYSVSVAVLALALSVPLAAHADDSAFARDRNVAVTDRIPKEYEPLGLRWGVFDVSPRLDVTASTNDNVFYRPTGQVSDAILSVDPSISINSDWSRHALSASLSAADDTYSKYNALNTVTWNAALGGRLDIQGNSNAYGGVTYSQNYESLYDPSAPRSGSATATAAAPVKYDTTVGDVGFVAESDRLKFSGSVYYTKYNYFDVRSLAGTLIDQDGRDFEMTDIRGRVDYALSPAVSLYVDYDGNRRAYQTSVVNRNSHGYNVDAGSSFDITNLMRGEVQVGYLQQTYTNSAFKPAKGGFVSGKIQYFPTQLLTLGLQSTQTVQETPDIGVSGYLSTATTLSADYELLRTLVISGSYGFTADKYNGEARHDDLTNFDLSAKYLVSRNVVLKAEYIYSDNKSTGAAAIPSYKDNAFKLTLGLQY